MTEIHCHFRWAIKRDMPEILAIENSCFAFPWQEDDFVHSLRQRNCICVVAEHDDRVVGFYVYELHKHRLHILNIAVHPAFQGLTVGTQLIDKLKSRLSERRRSRIMIEVVESNLEAQLFFQSQGFRAVSILRDFFEESDAGPRHDAYLFQYIHGEDIAEEEPHPIQLEDMLVGEKYEIYRKGGPALHGTFNGFTRSTGLAGKRVLRIRIELTGGREKRIPVQQVTKIQKRTPVSP